MIVTDSEEVTGKYRKYTHFQQLHTFCYGVKSVLLKTDENTAKYKEVHPNCPEDNSWRINVDGILTMKSNLVNITFRCKMD
jgi:hypothetical protein